MTRNDMIAFAQQRAEQAARTDDYYERDVWEECAVMLQHGDFPSPKDIYSWAANGAAEALGELTAYQGVMAWAQRVGARV